MFKRLTLWRTRRYMATLPTLVTKNHGGDILLEIFKRDMGRDFNVWRGEDRRLLSHAVTMFLPTAANHIFNSK